MGTLVRETTHFSFASLLNEGQLLKESICSCRSKFFPFRVDPISEGFCYPGKQTRKYKSCSPFLKWGKHEFPYSLCDRRFLQPINYTTRNLELQLTAKRLILDNSKHISGRLYKPSTLSNTYHHKIIIFRDNGL